MPKAKFLNYLRHISWWMGLLSLLVIWHLVFVIQFEFGLCHLTFYELVQSPGEPNNL